MDAALKSLGGTRLCDLGACDVDGASFTSDFEDWPLSWSLSGSCPAGLISAITWFIYVYIVQYAYLFGNAGEVSGDGHWQATILFLQDVRTCVLIWRAERWKVLRPLVFIRRKISLSNAFARWSLHLLALRH